MGCIMDGVPLCRSRTDHPVSIEFHRIEGQPRPRYQIGPMALGEPGGRPPNQVLCETVVPKNAGLPHREW